MIAFVDFVDFVDFVFSDGMSDLERLKEIEKIIGEKLELYSYEDKETIRGYCLNDNNQIISLRLMGFELENIDFLIGLKSLIELHLNMNRLSDVSALKELKNLTRLDLGANELSDIGALKGLKNLTFLDLNHNQLSNINALKELTTLKILILGTNNLGDINALKELNNLTELHLWNNQLSDISPLIELKNITELSLPGNKLSDINPLRELKNITWLDLSGNKLRDVSPLKKLKNITWIDLNYNKLSQTNGLQKLKNLTGILLSNNQLSDISALKGLKNITEIDLSHNQLSNISALKELKNLVRLNLINNQLEVLPEWILNFNLRIEWNKGISDDCIFLEKNPLKQPPPEVIVQGNNAIRTYFEQLKQQGIDYICEAKLILLGEGGAGKTSLANKIINSDYQLISESESISTQGIDILRYSFPYKDSVFQVNIWDFGGQEIYHQTHQFFLSKRSLYFIVIDSRADSPNLDYWFKLVELLSNNSPLLIIKNEKQNRPCSSIQEGQLKAEFENIKDSFLTNLSDNRGLETIVTALQHHISQLPHIGTPLPKTWVKVREQLEQDNRYHIDLKDYFNICQENGFEKEADKLQLSGYLHDLGVCLHFQDDELLRKTLILKPTWATDAVYKVLDNRQVINNFGRFNKDDLADIWQDQQYTTMRGELLALMLNFKLCFEIPNKAKHYIAPQLLDNNAPDYPWQAQDNLLLRYQYEFMPKGLVSQFIVVMHEHIADDYSLLWKSGVVLEKEQTRAEIIEYYGKREIHIRVSGQQKKELLNIVSYELDKINNSYERLKDKCKKLIPCNCSDCSNSQQPYFYNYQKLKERIAHHKHTIECGNPPYADVEILKLIDDIDLRGFENLEGLHSKAKTNTQQIQVTINANQENDMSEGRSINTGGGTYIEGDMKGGNIAGRDININGGKAMTKEEFLQLLQTFKQEVAESELPEEIVEAVTDDVENVEKQLKKEKPNGTLVNNKVKGMNDLLENTDEIIDAVEKGSERFEKIMTAAGALMTGLSFLL